MTSFTLAEIQNLSLGQFIPSFRAQIKEVKQYSKGTHAQYGEWSLQNLVVLDSTGICQVKVKNHPEFNRDTQQKWVVFETTTNKKDGMMQGIRWKEDDYKGRKSNVIEVTASALVTFDGAGQPAPGHDVDFEPPFERLPSPPLPPPPIPPLHHQPQPDTAQGIQNAKEELGRTANGLIMSYDATIYVATEVRKKHPDVIFTPDAIERIAVHMSIRLEKSGVLHGLPAGPLPKKKGEEQ